MKRKIVNFVLLSSMIFGLGACSNEKSEGAHHFSENYLYDNVKHWKECTDKGCNQQINVAIHEFLDWTIVEDSTCSKPGKEMSKCSVCDYVIEREIPIKDHNVSNEWVNDSNYHWHTCQNDPDEKVDYNAHSFVWIYATEPTCTSTGRGHQECSVCGYKLPEQDIPSNGHAWEIDDANTTYATCSTAGVVTHKCSVCGATETKTVQAGHSWGEPEYSWNSDYSAVTATRVCTNDPSHIETETVSTIHTHTSPTCDVEGNDTYETREFANPSFRKQSKVISLAKCSETLVHRCEAEKYTAGSVYDECSVCHKRYNEIECNQPWEDLDLGTEMTANAVGDNGAGLVSSYDADSKVLTLPKHSGAAAWLDFTTEGALEKSLNKSYFVMTYTLLEDSGGWWDTYLTISGFGEPSKIRFGRIDSNAVASQEMYKATFFVDGEEVSWNAVLKGMTGTVYVDISAIRGGVNSISMHSDGGVKLQIDYVGFRSTMCDHDISCYHEVSGVSCAGFISTKASVCQECGCLADVKTAALPTGYSAIDLGNPLGVRWESKCYDYSLHIITIPNTYHPGPIFANPKGTRMLAEIKLDWDETVISNPSDARFELYFMNQELVTEGSNENMQTHYFNLMCSPNGISDTNAGITNPTKSNVLARYLDNVTGDPVTSFRKGETIVVDIDISDPTVGDFSKFIVSGCNGTIVTINNIIYCR